MRRRNFLKLTIASAVPSILNPIFSSAALPINKKGNTKIWEGVDLSWSPDIPPLFIIAYVDPHIKSQRNQESIIAKYPVAIVSQSNSLDDILFRDKIKKINHNIFLLGYQIVAEETTIPGPGHDVLRKVKNSWVTYAGGIQPKVNVSGVQTRLYDFRKEEWQDLFLEACDATLKSYPYNGLFLDQCSVYTVIRLADIRGEMIDALKYTLNLLREKYPLLPIIANSSFDFEMVNGELNENRLYELSSEASDKKSVSPAVSLYQSIQTDINNTDAIKKECIEAFKNKSFFGVCVNYQKAEWPAFFDEIVSLYH